MVCRTDRMEKIEWYLSYRKWRAERNRRLREVAKEYVLAKMKLDFVNMQIAFITSEVGPVPPHLFKRHKLHVVP